ncbi:putative integration host factor, alpha subunit [Proteus penneri ATCC 35198]|nr:putative integration host factor, alpha subunit [Proteus penneri ATCC 35198]
MALTKAEMAENLFEKLGVSKRDAKDLVESFFEEVRRSLENGEQVKLSGFGNFDLRDKNQRPGRNPKKQGKTFLLQLAVLLLSDQDKS